VHDLRNEKGGVFITRAEIESAFKFLDADKSGRISLAQIKKKLGVFFPEMHAKDFKLLLKNRKETSVEELTALLLDNQVTQFDPVYEAFRAYDPQGDGCISKDNMAAVFTHLGLPPLGQNDVDMLFSVADLDNDGRISLDDFRALLALEGPAICRPNTSEKTNDDDVLLDHLT
jgi:calmodulin